jgi:outer membrane receptor protein involved in Fe transport
VHSAITITASVKADAPASMTILDQTSIQQLPGLNVDDRLRTIPGFTLFRRSSSIVANPTTQGISLRGIGSTGASRTLVLWDGIPLNDPFGGWVYWDRVDPNEIGRAEVARGASTSVFGDKAMGGTLGLFSPAADQSRFAASYAYGNRNTNQLTASGAWVNPRWTLSGQGRAFTTDGYYIVPESVRGPVDTPANVRFATGILRFDFSGLFLRADLLTERRDNGTQLQRNSTSLGSIAANYARESFSALVYHSTEEYRASFSSISANRQTERLTNVQSIPSQATGGNAFFRWRRVIAGGDATHVSTSAGGDQNQQGLFTQGNIEAGPVRLFGGVRVTWTGGHPFWSPSGGATWKWLRVSAYRAFRVPTLNELYRDFRAGNAVTLPNPNLLPETLTGVEVGVDWRNRNTGFSATAFNNSLGDLITNVTLISTPNLITRQRRNAASAYSRGVEADFHRTFGAFQLQLAYLYANARYSTGERIPQTPRNAGTAQLGWTHRGTSLWGGMRGATNAFEDDRNQFLLPSYTVWGISARQALPHKLTAFLSFENLFNEQIIVGYSPTPLIGAPRLWQAGLRWNF